jgi:predicted RNA-binding Zn-ribbon protein involved in translation (DUF1610 family)
MSVEKSKPLDLVVTKGGIPFEDQAEGVRQFKAAALAAAKAQSFRPCPFCAGTIIRDHHIRDGRAISCASCGASVHAFSPDALTTATVKWNRRDG